MNILLIEDHLTDSKLFSVVLTHGGHTVRHGASAKEAILEIKACHPDVILLDLNLPGTDGLELARQLKSDLETSRIPIVAVTALPGQFPRTAALAAGCDAYIIKPVNTRSLADQLEAAIKGVA